MNCPSGIDEDMDMFCSIDFNPVCTGSPVISPSTTCTGAEITNTGGILATLYLPAQGEAAGPGSCVIGVEIDSASDLQVLEIREVD